MFKHRSGYGGSCPEGIPVEFGLLSILAAFGVAFGVLYMALTIITGKRKKRSYEDGEEDSCEASSIQGYYGCHLQNFMSGEESSVWFHIADVLWHGELGSKKMFENIGYGEISEQIWDALTMAGQTIENSKQSFSILQSMHVMTS